MYLKSRNAWLKHHAILNKGISVVCPLLVFVMESKPGFAEHIYGHVNEFPALIM
jgi:hypothetical protein